jgi:hypothetical protein
MPSKPKALFLCTIDYCRTDFRSFWMWSEM